MEKPRTANDLDSPVPRFCLALEEFRRTPDGRIRTSQEFLDHFCPNTDTSCTDRIFKYIPPETRGPILAAWGIRGPKAATKDTDEKVQSVLHESLSAGDIDHSAFEEGLGPDVMIRWAPMSDWWIFWRGGKLTKAAIRRALEAGYDLGLFDARWFLDTIEAQGGRVRGTDVLSEGLSKADLTTWIRRIHESRDGTPKGILTALGWEMIVTKTIDSVLIAVLDAMAVKVGLKVLVNAPGDKAVVPTPVTPATTTPATASTPTPAASAKGDTAARPAVTVTTPANPGSVSLTGSSAGANSGFPSVVAPPLPAATPNANDDFLSDEDLEAATAPRTDDGSQS